MTSTEPQAPVTPQVPTQEEHLEALGRYQWGWADSDAAGAAAQRG